MSKKSEHRKSDKQFLRYTSGNMTDRERNAYEKKLQKDPFEAEAAEGFSSLSPEELKEDLSALDIRIRSGITGKTNFLRIAAGFAILITISGLFYLLVDREISLERKNSTITETVQPLEKNDNLTEPQKVESDEKETIKIPQKTIQPPKSEKQINHIDESVSISRDLSTEKKSDSQSPQEIMSGAVQKKRDEKPAMTNNPVTSDRIAVASSRESFPKVLSGRVVSSEDYQPLTGVNVNVKGSRSSVISDTNGNFSIPIDEGKDSVAELQFNFIGMESQEIVADAGSFSNVVMNPAEFALNEVVMTKDSSRKQKSSSKKERLPKAADSEIILAQNPAFEKYVADNQIFPESNEQITRALVTLDFNIDNSGRPYDIKVVESPGKEFSDEAIRLLKSGPSWQYTSTGKSRVKILLSKNP